MDVLVTNDPPLQTTALHVGDTSGYEGTVKAGDSRDVEVRHHLLFPAQTRSIV